MGKTEMKQNYEGWDSLLFPFRGTLCNLVRQKKGGSDLKSTKNTSPFPSRILSQGKLCWYLGF